MDREKVFDAFRNCITEPKCKDCPWEDCERFECKRTDIPISLGLDILKLLKEQEAVEPKQVVRKQCKKEHDDGSIEYFAEWYCPHCNMLILRGFDNPSIKFCYKCGKPILWEGR